MKYSPVKIESVSYDWYIHTITDLLKDKEGAQSLYQDLVDSGCKVDKSFTDLLTNEQAKSPSPRRRRKNIKTVSSENLDWLIIVYI